MKKLLVTLLLSILLLFSPVITEAQSGATFKFTAQSGYKWQNSGEALCGVGNVWCGVFRSAYKNAYGYYEYYVWFKSNSYFNDCAWSRTYLENIEVMYYSPYYNGWYYPKEYKPFTWTVGDQTLYYTFYDTAPDVSYKVKVRLIEPTIY